MRARVIVPVVLLAATAARAESVSTLVEKLRPAVVNIQAIRAEPSTPGETAAHASARSLGSGFIIDPAGIVVTNAHVVTEASTVRVVLYDQRNFRARVLGRDARSDLAVLELDGAANLPTVRLGDSDDLRVGDPVIAIGNPFGLGSSVTSGILSAKERNLGDGAYEEMLQTDASINPGNSGGPLFDGAGQVVGISTAVLENGQGIGFAIPIETARFVIDQLRKNGKVERGWIGVGIQDVTPELAAWFHSGSPNGALIASVDKGSPADKAGLSVGDVITQYDGKTITTSSRLPRYVSATHPGRRATVEVVRDGKHIEKQIAVEQLAGEQPARPAAPPKKALPALGLKVTPKDGGLEIDDVDPSSAAIGALSPGDLVLDMDRIPVKNAADIDHVVARHKANDSVLVRVKRGNLTVFVPVGL